MQTQMIKQNDATKSKSEPSSDLDPIALLDKKVEEMTVQLQHTLDESTKSFADRFVVTEDTIKALNDKLTKLESGVTLRASAETTERISSATTTKAARSALYDAVDEEVAQRNLEGKVRPMVHQERRTAFAVLGVYTAGVALMAGGITSLVLRRAAKRNTDKLNENPEVKAAHDAYVAAIETANGDGLEQPRI